MGVRTKATTLFATLLMAGLFCAGKSESLTTSAKILEVTERGFVLKVGTEPLAVEDTPETKLWRACAKSERGAFKAQDSVQVRIKTDSDPPTLREMADPESWAWLEKIRKEPQKATIEKMDAKSIDVRFPDGKAFTYRYSDNTEITLGGKKASASELAKGQTIYLKGRLYSSLDTGLAKVSDLPILGKPVAKPKREKFPPLPPSGSLEGKVLEIRSNLRMIDLEAEGRTLHITYSQNTAITLDGKPAGLADIAKGQRCHVQYKRDKTGRILASKVELFSPNA